MTRTRLALLTVAAACNAPAVSATADTGATTGQGTTATTVAG
jgi:hypothetical protein